MKNKILSIALILGILLSIVGSIPISAEEVSVMRELPYAFYDCEDGVTAIKTTTIGNYGMGESAKCMVYTENTATNNDRRIHIGDDSTALSGQIPAGYTFALSFYMKIPQKLTPGKLLLLINYTDATGATASYYPDATFDGENTTDWQKIEFTYKPDIDVTLNTVSLRFGHHGTVTNTVVGGSSTTQRTYYIDDLTVSVTSPDLKPPVADPNDAGVVLGNKLDTLNDYNLDFENGSSLATYISGPGWSSALEEPVAVGESAMQIVADPADSTNKAMKLSLASDKKDFGLSFRNVTGTGGGQTTIVGGSVPADHRMVYTFRYRFGQEMNSSNGVYEGKEYRPEFSISLGSNRVATSQEVFSASADEWYEAKLIYDNNTGTTQEITGAEFRVAGANNDGKGKYRQWVATGHTGYNTESNAYDLGERIVYIDDVRITIEKMVVTEKYGSLADYKMGFDNASTVQIYVSGSGWINANSSATVSGGESLQVVADPQDSTKKALKVTLASNLSGGSTGMRFANTTDNGGNNPATGTIPAGGKVTYKFRYYLGQEVETSSTDGTKEYKPEFCIANTTGAGMKFAVPESELATDANQWHTATLTYTNNTSSAQTITNANLRCAGHNMDGKEKYKNWVVKGYPGWNGSVGEYGERVIYFDDFRIFITAEGEEPPADDTDAPETPDEPEEEIVLFPVSKDISVTGEFKEGNKVVFNHTATLSDGATADKSLVRLMHTTKNGVKASLSSCIAGNAFTVPHIPESGTLIFEVIPVDNAGVLGYPKTYRFAQITGQEIRLELFDFDAQGNVTAKATIDNQRFDGSDINAVLIVQMHNEKGAVVKFVQLPLACANGNIVTGSDGTIILESDTSNPELSKVTKATALLWDCGDATLPSTDNTLMEELITDLSVEK